MVIHILSLPSHISPKERNVQNHNVRKELEDSSENKCIGAKADREVVLNETE